MPDRLRLDGLPRETDELVLRVGISAYTGWKSLSVERSIEAAAGTFALEYYDPRPLFVAPGSRVSLAVGFSAEVGAGSQEVQVLAGAVDSITAEKDADGTRLQVAGRDALADLVDCSVAGASEWRGLDLVELARALAAPFQVQVVEGILKTVGAVFDPFRVQPGETAWQAIERAARLRGLLAFGNERGELVIERPGPRRADVDLVWGGELLLSARLEYTHASRFRTYTVRGQGAGADLDLLVGTQVHPSGQAIDEEIRAGRELVILAEGPVSASQASTRAAWEASIRAARGARVVVTVLGWRQTPGGVLWKINELVRVAIPDFELDRDLLVSAVRFLRDERGTRAELVLVRPDAYLPEAQVDPRQDPFAAFTSDAEGLDE